MANRRFIKTKANFTLEKKVGKSVNGGDIIERDYMTISDHGESNFKFSDNILPSLRKKHKMASVTNNGGVLPIYNGKVSIKPNYESILDFANFGSAVDLLKASITNIITNYPASIEIKKNEKGVIKYYNELGIDIFNKRNVTIFSNNEDKDNAKYNDIRKLRENIGNYLVKIGETTYGIKKTEVIETVSHDNGFNNECKDLYKVYTVKIYYQPNNFIEIVRKYNFTKKVWEESFNGVIPNNSNVISIKLKDEVYKDIINSFNDFEKVLINKDNIPIFKAVFGTPLITERGKIFYKENYIWPNKDGVNPTVNGLKYENYIKSLYDLAQFFDEERSDYIWRMMTHESIKNLDWTFSRGIGSEFTEDLEIDTSRIKPSIRLYGRQFDELKKYIDTIEYSGNVTYDEKNNMPYELLSEELSISGWDVYSITPDSFTEKFNFKYGDLINKELSRTDVESEFMKRLKLSTANIFSKKGTIEGIEELLGIMGFDNEDYSIKEYYYVATPKEGNEYPKYSDVESINKYRDGLVIDDINKYGYLYGLPLKRVTTTDEKGDTLLDYVIPWVNNGEKYINDIYFQCDGGWSNHLKNKLYNPITEKYTNGASFSSYEETYPTLKILNSVKSIETLVGDDYSAGDIIYITDLSDMADVYKLNDDEANTGFSHYFILKNKDLVNNAGKVTNDSIEKNIGWKNIHESEFTEPYFTDDAIKVMQLESMSDSTVGNNPHKGNGVYDDGKRYIDNFKQLLKEENFSNLSETEIKEIKDKMNSIGYIMRKYEDKNKCYYFWNVFENSNISGIDEDKYNNFFSPEKLKKYDESAANSIINVKNIDITFNISGYSLEEFKEYVERSVIPYLIQMIPTTSIFSYSFNGEVAIDGVCGGDCAIVESIA